MTEHRGVLALHVYVENITTVRCMYTCLIVFAECVLGIMRSHVFCLGAAAIVCVLRQNVMNAETVKPQNYSFGLFF